MGFRGSAGYSNTLANVVREQAVALRGAAWCDEHLPLIAIGVSPADPVRWTMFHLVARGMALAHIEMKGTVSQADIDRHMPRCHAEAPRGAQGLEEQVARTTARHEARVRRMEAGHHD